MREEATLDLLQKIVEKTHLFWGMTMRKVRLGSR